MGYFDRQYQLFALLGAPDSPKLWEESQWQSLVADLGQYAESSRGKTAVRTTQYDTLGKKISFGRLGWNSNSHRKWVHSNAQDRSVRPTFHDLEVWAPARTLCWREELSPDFFFNVVNPNHLNVHSKILFNQVVVCALAQDLGTDRALALQRALRSFATILSAPIFVRKTRPWGLGPGHLGGYTNVVESMALLHLFEIGNPHRRPLNLDTFSESWELVQRFDA